MRNNQNGNTRTGFAACGNNFVDRYYGVTNDPIYNARVYLNTCCNNHTVVGYGIA